MTDSKLWIAGGGGIGLAVERVWRSKFGEESVVVTGSADCDLRRSGDVALKAKEIRPTHICFTAGINELCWLRSPAVGRISMSVMNVNTMTFITLVNELACLDFVDLRIVAIGSDAADRPMRGSTAYCVSKAALRMAVRCTAREMAGVGWRVNEVAPGMTEVTGMQQKLDEEIPAFRGWTPKYARDYENEQSVISRRATVLEVAHVTVDILLGPDYLTGSTITINGGR